MTLQGTLNSGIIVLDQPAPWPEGTRVGVLVQTTEEKPTLSDRLLEPAGRGSDLPADKAVALNVSGTSAGEHQLTLRGLLKLAGTLSDLPPDFAAEHDHYIHGTPKRGKTES